MKKLKTFFYVFKNSIVSPKYYNDVVKTNIGFSIKYFLLLSLFASVIFSFVFSFKAVPETRKFLNSFVEQVKNLYPQDLTMDFKGGNWTINKPEPYTIPMPRFDGDQTQQLPQNLAVLDKKGTIDDIDKLNTVMILNDKNIIYRDDGGKITAQPIGEIPDFSVDKSIVVSKIDELNKYLGFIPFFVPPLLFLFDFTFNFIGEGVFHILFAGFMIYLLSLIRKDNLNFKQSCQIIMHTMTAPIILQTILRFTPYNTYVKGWFFILNLLIAAVFMVLMRKNEDLIKIEKVD